MISSLARAVVMYVIIAVICCLAWILLKAAWHAIF